MKLNKHHLGEIGSGSFTDTHPHSHYHTLKMVSKLNEKLLAIY
jgi:hypothetical protein